MDVTPVIGILAIVGLVALVALAFLGLFIIGRSLSLEEGDPFFGNDDDPDNAI